MRELISESESRIGGKYVVRECKELMRSTRYNGYCKFSITFKSYLIAACTTETFFKKKFCFVFLLPFI